MATGSDVAKKPQEEQVTRESERTIPTRGKDKRNKSAAPDPMTALKVRLARVELIVANYHDSWDELDQHMEQLDGAELHEDMQGVLKEVVD